MKMIEQDDGAEEKEKVELKKRNTLKVDAKKVFVGTGARVLFYPTLLYNLLRYKIQSDFRWWDEVDQVLLGQFLVLGAVPLPKDVPRLKQHGVSGVITLNEPFETLVPPSLYKAHGMEHLVIPTRDYLYAPSLDDINRAVDFIHNNAACSRATYVHCKAGRGRSTTIALCYLVKHKQMTPSAAMKLIRSRRPRVLLTSMQAKAVQQYYRSCLAASGLSMPMNEVLVRKDDVEGYRENCDNTLTKKMKMKMAIIPKEVKALPKSRMLSSLVTVACGCLSNPNQHSKGGTC